MANVRELVGSAGIGWRLRTRATTSTSTFPWASALISTASAWTIARVIALSLQVLVRSTGQHTATQFPDGTPITGPMSQLFSWDGAWYLGISEHGYAAYGVTGLRFSPLLPLITRAVTVLGVPAAAAILAICWLAAFGLGLLVFRLTLELTKGDEAAARRAAWLSQLIPGAFALTMGYSEALFGVCAVTFLIAVLRPADADRGARADAGAHAEADTDADADADAARSPTAGLWPWLGMLAGVGAGLARPVGFLLVLPGLIELVRQRRVGLEQSVTRLAVALAPAVGTLAYLLWCRRAFGQLLLPYTVQSTPGLHGGLATDPLRTTWDMLNVPTMTGLEMLTLILAAGALGLLWVSLRRLPFSLTAWAGLMVLSGLTAINMAGFVRYAGSTVTLVVAAALITKDRRAWAWLLGSSVFGFAYILYGAFAGWYIP